MRSAVLGTLGSIGLGLVWGWLIGSFIGHVHRPARSFISIFLVTLTLVAQVILFLDWVRLLFFIGAALFTLFIHVEWRRKLLQLRNYQDFQ